MYTTHVQVMYITPARTFQHLYFHLDVLISNFFIQFNYERRVLNPPIIRKKHSGEISGVY